MDTYLNGDKRVLTGLVVVIYCIGFASCKIVGAFVLPHGGIALDPVNFNTTNHTARLEAKALHEACRKVGQDVQDVKPEVIFLSTPHGLADYRNFLVYSNAVAAGMTPTNQ